MSAAPKTPQEHLALAGSLDAQAAEFRKSAELAEAAARLHRAMAGMEEAALTTSRNADTIETQMHVESAGAGRSKGQMDAATLEHPFGKMLVRRKTTVADVAAFLTDHLKRKVPRSTVQAWYKPVSDPSYRPIRRDAAEALKAEYAVPLSAWPRIRE